MTGSGSMSPVFWVFFFLTGITRPWASRLWATEEREKGHSNVSNRFANLFKTIEFHKFVPFLVPCALLELTVAQSDAAKLIQAPATLLRHQGWVMQTEARRRHQPVGLASEPLPYFTHASSHNTSMWKGHSCLWWWETVTKPHCHCAEQRQKQELGQTSKITK